MKPAVKWGLIGGLLSAIPCVNIVNCLCCAWAWAAGLMTAREEAAGRAQYGAGDGVKDSLLAGAVAGAVLFVLATPINLLFRGANAKNAEMIARMIPQDNAFGRGIAQGMASSGSVVGIILNALMTAVILAAFVVVGGAIGGLIFKKPKG